MSLGGILIVVNVIGTLNKDMRQMGIYVCKVSWQKLKHIYELLTAKDSAALAIVS